MRLKWTFALLTAACLLLAACSARRLAYDHLDTLLRWEISDYVDLTQPQRQSLDAELDTLWRWHRRTQLPLYAADLRKLAGQVQAGPLDAQQIETASKLADQRWDDLVGQVLPAYARLTAQLDEAQAAQLIGRIGKRIDKHAAKRRKQTPEERDRHLEKGMDELLHDWIGRPDERQKALVRQWVTQTPPAPEAEAQHALLDRYAAVLASRGQDGYEQRLRDFLHDEDARDDSDPAQQQREKLWRQLLVDVSASLDAEQRETLRRHLLEYAEDCEGLAAEQPAAAQ
jgi:hypothetical protein